MAEGFIKRNGIIAPPTFIEATGGTTTTYEDSGTFYKSHTFNSSGDFVVSAVGNGDRNEVDYLIIAGGASGGAYRAGGGGAGGYRTTLGTSGGNSTAESKVIVTAQTYGITIGAGGATVSGLNRGNNGVNTTALGITSTGGGGGGCYDGNQNGINGASGGGASRTEPSQVGEIFGGDGIAGQGFDGGLGSNDNGGGGGGAGQLGQNAPTSSLFIGGNGGDGLANILRTGSAETRAGGGGGGTGFTSSALGGAGGTGGGGTGGSNVSGTSGTVNTGSGGGGGGQSIDVQVSGAGGSGIVVIRYEVGGL